MQDQCSNGKKAYVLTCQGLAKEEIENGMILLIEERILKKVDEPKTVLQGLLCKLWMCLQKKFYTRRFPTPSPSCPNAKKYVHLIPITPRTA